MSESWLYFILFAVLMFFMHRGHGHGGGCGGHAHHGDHAHEGKSEKHPMSHADSHSTDTKKLEAV